MEDWRIPSSTNLHQQELAFFATKAHISVLHDTNG